MISYFVPWSLLDSIDSLVMLSSSKGGASNLKVGKGGGQCLGRGGLNTVETLKFAIR